MSIFRLCRPLLGAAALALAGVLGLRVGVTSPCYFIRKLTDSDGGTLPSGDITKVTGFIQQNWDR
ncbi:hypothetical protein ACWDTD_06925 [Gordonia sp. NPDC003425]